jgi:hypothetical protein
VEKKTGNGRIATRILIDLPRNRRSYLIIWKWKEFGCLCLLIVFCLIGIKVRNTSAGIAHGHDRDILESTRSGTGTMGEISLLIGPGTKYPKGCRVAKFFPPLPIKSTNFSSFQNQEGGWSRYLELSCLVQNELSSFIKCDVSVFHSFIHWFTWFIRKKQISWPGAPIGQGR